MRELRLREPRLIEADSYFAGKTVDEVLADLQEGFGRVVTLACGADHPCPFLTTENRCEIYPTRPNECVGMLAGDDQCQMARKAAGLEPLLPVDETP